MHPERSAPAPLVDESGVTFTLRDPAGRLAGVRLQQELGLSEGLDFTRRAGLWKLRLPRPPVEGGAHRVAAISVCAAAPDSTSIQRVPARLDSLYALAYMHSHDGGTARRAVADAVGSVRRDLAARCRGRQR